MHFLLFFQVFVFLLSILVTMQQALSSGYLNSAITTIEKRYEIPSSISGIIASMYEIGNVITVIFVSYLGSRRHIPIFIGVGKFPTFQAKIKHLVRPFLCSSGFVLWKHRKIPQKYDFCLGCCSTLMFLPKISGCINLIIWKIERLFGGPL